MELNRLYEASSQGATHYLAEDPVSDSHYLMVEAERLPTTVCIPLDRGELKLFKQLLEAAAEVLPSLAAGQITMIGELPPAPIVLGLNAVAPPNRPSFLLARLSQRTNKVIDFAMGGLEDVKGIAKRIDVQLAGKNIHKPVEAEIVSFEGAALTIDPSAPREFKFIRGFSQCRGRFGEYRDRGELRSGDSVKVWACPFEGAQRVERVQLLPVFEQVREPSHRPESAAFEAIASRGEAADSAMHRGAYYRAFTTYEKLQNQLLKSKTLDTFLASKILLSQIVCQARRGNTQEAGGLWTGSAGTFSKLGVKLIEGGALSANDTLLYHEVSCYLQSLGSDPERALVAVNHTMERMLASCQEQDGDRRCYLLSNWRIHLMEIFEGSVPKENLAPWNAWQAKLGRPVEAKALYFRRPSPWVISWEAERPSVESSRKPWWKRLFAR